MQFSAPQECKDQNWFFDPVSANVSYAGVKEVDVGYPALGDGYEELTATLNDPTVYREDGIGVGWNNQEELNLLAEMQDQIDFVLGRIPTEIVPEVAKAAIQKLADAAQTRLDAVQAEYDAYHEDYPDSFPLSTWAASPYPKARQAGLRTAVAQNIKDAGKLLHCALFGIAQSESYMRNKAIYEEESGDLKFAPAAPARSTIKFPVFSNTVEVEDVELTGEIGEEDPGEGADGPDGDTDEEDEYEKDTTPAPEGDFGMGMILGLGGLALVAALLYTRKS